MNNVDLNAYKTFYIVAKYNSFTKAAHELYISQPAVTQTIKKLEEQLNIKLFNRSSNGVISLTPAGEVVYYYSEQLCNLALANRELIQRAKNACIDVINIGVPTHVGAFILSKYIKKFNDINSNYRFNIVNKKSDEMLEMLKKRELDIVLDTNLEEYSGDIIKTKKIAELSGCFVCGKKYKNLSLKEKVDLVELNNYPLILPSGSTSNRKVLDATMKEYGIILKPIVEANSSSICRRLIIDGVGIGWMLENFIQDDLNNEEMFKINIDYKQNTTPLSIAYNIKFNIDIIEEFINLFEKDI